MKDTVSPLVTENPQSRC